MPSGTFDIVLEGYNTEGESVDNGGWAFLQYCTVEIAAADSHIMAKMIDPAEGRLEDKLIKVKAGSFLSIDDRPDEGYKFDRYAAVGIEPSIWSPSAAKQEIRIDGPVIIKAYSAPIEYTVAFDPNGGEGSMSPLGVAYDEQKKLPEHKFSKRGYSFIGWARMPRPQGAETIIADETKIGADMEHFTTKDGEVVTLYAVWEHNHSWESAWGSDNTAHWHECEGIGGCDITDNSKKDGYALHSGGAATCTENAVCEVCGAAYGNAIGHSYQFDSFVWAGSYAEAKYVCAKDESHVTYRSAAVTIEKETDGIRAYTAAFDGHTDTKTEVILAVERGSDVPNTGDTDNIGFWLSLAVIALCGMAAVMIIYARVIAHKRK